MKEKISKIYRLSPDTVEKLEKYAEENNLSKSAALDMIINEHLKEDANIKKFLDAFDNKYKNVITRIRLSSREADINVQILIEMMNTLMFFQSINSPYTTSTGESPVYKACKEEVKEKISHYKQIKDNAQKNEKGRKDVAD